MSSKFTNDLTKDSVIKQLILFSLPVLLSNIIQSLYSVADMIIVGRFAGTVSMSGVNIGSQVTFLITNMVFGLTTGATVLVGQYLGAGNRKALSETINTLFTTLVLLAAGVTVVRLEDAGKDTGNVKVVKLEDSMPKPEDNVQVVKLPEEPKVDELASISNQLEAENTKLNESKKELKEQIDQVKSTDETGSSALKDTAN